MVIYLVAAAVLAGKFLAYAAYAGALNRRFGTTHSRLRVAGLRMLLSLVFTAINVGLFRALAHLDPVAFEAITFSPVPLITAVLFAMLAWYIVLRAFFIGPSSASGAVAGALALGTLLSAAIAVATAFLGMLGVMSEVRLC